MSRSKTLAKGSTEKPTYSPKISVSFDRKTFDALAEGISMAEMIRRRVAQAGGGYYRRCE